MHFDKTTFGKLQLVFSSPTLLMSYKPNFYFDIIESPTYFFYKRSRTFIQIIYIFFCGGWGGGYKLNKNQHT